ncbi:MAG: hypothetical protein AMXMBFR53_02610 [Gemmatimonadota bacterium]
MTRATAAARLLAVLVAACGGDAAEEAAPEVLVLESPHVAVLVGTDTVEVFTPTLLAYFATDLGTGDPPSGLLLAADAFQATLRDATPGLEALSVRVLPAGDVPRPLGIPPEVDRDAGPSLQPGGAGFLLVLPRGRIRRLDRSASGSDLVCAAARLMETAAPPQLGRDCG